MSRKPVIGIMGGSFDPVHVGHIMLADYLAQFAGLDEVWMMLSPQNPLKRTDARLLQPPVADADRLAMLEIACASSPRLRPCSVELTMPRPSYSIDSLSLLAEEMPDSRLRLIIGSDNWILFDRWRRSDEIIRRFDPIVYPRPGYPVDAAALPPQVTLAQAPTIDLSSTFVRRAIADGRDMSLFVPRGVWRYITDNGLYRLPKHNRQSPT